MDHYGRNTQGIARVVDKREVKNNRQPLEHAMTPPSVKQRSLP
jgi:hypothetical protein